MRVGLDIGKFGGEVGSMIVGASCGGFGIQPMNLTFGIQPTIYSFLSTVAFSLMIDSLFNLSEKNLLTAMFTHQSAGTMNLFLHKGHENIFMLILLGSIVILLRIREWTERPARLTIKPTYCL